MAGKVVCENLENIEIIKEKKIKGLNQWVTRGG